MSELLNIQNRIFGGTDEDEQTVQTMYTIMKEFGFTLVELKQMPITTFKYLIHFLNKENKEADKKMNRGKK